MNGEGKMEDEGYRGWLYREEDVRRKGNASLSDGEVKVEHWPCLDCGARSTHGYRDIRR